MLLLHALLLGPLVAAPSSVGGAPQLPTAEFPSPRVGTRDYGDRLVGVGPRYRVSVDAQTGAWTFSAALGSQAQSLVRLGLELLEIRRGARRMSAGDGSMASADGTRLQVGHAAGWTETMDLDAAGAKHSIVFETAPSGAGDLVALFEVQADGLELMTGGDGESLRWRGPEGGGISLGAVVGIDARGIEVTGSAHLSRGLLELRLPGEFVDAAAYPLTLDPLIGAFVQHDSGQEDRDSDAAFVENGERFLSVWTVAYTATDTDTYAQRFDLDGTPVGPVIVLDGLINPVTTRARVGADSENGVFGIAWERFDGTTEWLEVLGVRASDGVVGSTVAILEAGSGVAYAPDLGGAAPNGNLLCAYRGPTGEIQGALVQLDALGNASIAPTAGSSSFQISSGFSDFRPVVSERPSPQDHRWLVAWERFFDFPAPGDFDIAAVPVADVGGTVGGEALFFSSIGPNEIEPACAPNFSFNTFFLAAAVEESTGSGVYDVRAVPIASGDDGTTSGNSIPWRARPNVDERAPSLAYNGTSIAIALESEDLTTLTPVRRIEVGGLDPVSSAVHDPFQVLEFSSFTSSAPAVASAWGHNSDCLLTYTNQLGGGSTTDIRSVGWRPESGTITPMLEDACGPNLTTAPGAVGGNPNFKVRLSAQAGNLTNLLLISASRIDIPCGTCLIVPDPTSGPVINVGPGFSNGTIETSLSIPLAAAGRTYFLQWLTADLGSTQCPEIGVDLIRPLEIFID